MTISTQNVPCLPAPSPKALAKAKVRNTDFFNSPPAEAAGLVAEGDKLAAEEREGILITTARRIRLGELANEYDAKWGVKHSETQRRWGIAKQTLSEWTTAARLPAEFREANAPVRAHMMAVNGVENYGRDPANVMGEIKAGFPNGIPQGIMRASNGLFAELKAKEERERNGKPALFGVLPKHGDIIDRCHHADYQDVAKQLPDASVEVIYADPPYISEGILAQSRTKRSVSRRECANSGLASALTTTNALFPVAARLLKPNGVLLLKQQGGLLNSDIQTAIAAAGMEVVLEIIWDKLKSCPNHMNWPSSDWTEKVYVVVRKGEQPRNRNRECRYTNTNVWSINAIHHDAQKHDEHHSFQTPWKFDRRLVWTWTKPGDVVFEPFGCQGGVSIQCLRRRRHFIYCELSDLNFEFGAKRIDLAKHKLLVAGGRELPPLELAAKGDTEPSVSGNAA